LPKVYHKLDKHLPYFVSSIWQPYRWPITAGIDTKQVVCTVLLTSRTQHYMWTKVD